MNNIKYVIFDFGGVFVEEAFSKARIEYAKKTGIPISKIWKEIKPYWKALEKGDISEEEFWNMYETQANDKKFKKEEIRALFESKQKRNEEIVNLILDLRKKGYKTALLTNNVKEWFEDYNKTDPLDNYFDIIVSSHETKTIKPFPEIYQTMLERLKAKPEECVFIDDKQRNLDTAVALGMKTVLCLDSKKAIKEICDLLYF